jgi:putative FmdB family regulatory protein
VANSGLNRLVCHMPTYDYECHNGHRFEVIQKMSDAPVTECPEFGGAALRKISGGVGFLFKGDGFYITESRSEDYKKKASADQGGSSTPDSSPTSKSDTSTGGGSSEAKPKPSSDS